MRTLRPLGPRVEVTALASVSTPLRRLARASTPNLSSCYTATRVNTGRIRNRRKSSPQLAWNRVGCTGTVIYTYLVSETLLLEVQGRPGERGTLRSSREDRSPGRQSTLHGCENKTKLLSEKTMEEDDKATPRKPKMG